MRMPFHVRWKDKEITDPELLKKILKNTVIGRIDIGYVSGKKSEEIKDPSLFPVLVFSQNSFLDG
jgi:hypothetical protein